MMVQSTCISEFLEGERQRQGRYNRLCSGQAVSLKEEFDINTLPIFVSNGNMELNLATCREEDLEFLILSTHAGFKPGIEVSVLT